MTCANPWPAILLLLVSLAFNVAQFAVGAYLLGQLFEERYRKRVTPETCGHQWPPPPNEGPWRCTRCGQDIADGPVQVSGGPPDEPV